MSDAWKLATITSFEHVPISDTIGLLRVTAWSSSHGTSDQPRPTLVADDGHTVWRYAAVPAPADFDEILRAAYSVHAAAVTPETVFSFEFDDGFVIALPPPTAGAARLNWQAQDLTPLPDSPTPTGGESDDERRLALQGKITELSEELAETRLRLQAHGGGAAQTQTHFLALHLAAAETRAELQAVHELATLGVAAGDGSAPPAGDREAELSRRLAAAEESAALAEQRLTEATRRAEAAVLELAGEQDRLRTMEERIAQAELDVQEAVRKRDAAVAGRREAQQALEPLRAANARAEHALAEAQDTLRKMSVERDELSRQVEAFDEVAVKARERAAEADSERLQANARLAELETWSAELERRLTETTTALANARAAAQADESELRRLRGELAEAQAQLELNQAQLLAFGRGAAPEAAPKRNAGRTIPYLAPAAVSPSRLEALRRAATDDAHRQAQRDLDDLSSNGRR